METLMLAILIPVLFWTSLALIVVLRTIAAVWQSCEVSKIRKTLDTVLNVKVNEAKTED